VHATRFELDPSTRAEIIAAEITTRENEGDTPEKIATA
jgi:hypothetical protein